MNTHTGEIASMEEWERRGTPKQFLRRILPRKEIRKDQVINAIPIENLSLHVRAQMLATGRAFVTRNSKCPCGSGKRFKRCCKGRAS